MEIREFTQKVQESVSKRLGKDYEVRIQKVQKNNNVSFYGLLILSKKSNVSPTIYLDSFFDAYARGAELSEIVSKIISLYREDAPGKDINMDFFKCFEKVKDRICYRLISAEANSGLLEKIPYVPFLDMAITFYYAYQGQEIGSGTILIYNSHVQLWGTCVRELMCLARENTPRLFKWEIRSMRELLGEGENTEGEPEEEMYPEVLSNEQRTFGAASILYPGLLEELAGRVQKNFYILPSSVHEVILLADNGNGDPRMLRQIVEEVNATQVEPQEVLSSQIYYYDKSEKSVKIIF